MKSIRIILVFFIILQSGISSFGQISPGDLCKAHAHLDGISNCTQCHDVGNKVSREKCLACHKEIKAKIVANKGYHASSEVRGKNCATCHNDHHGRNFEVVKFDKDKFDHAKTGFVLRGEHAKQKCTACHNAQHITDPALKKKKSTYLGLNKSCLSCHSDYHQGKMSANCAECHNFDSWKNAKTFDHSKTRFPLFGQHRKLKCTACHATELVNGEPAQKFTEMKFANCTPCHKDEHNNRFGQNCKSCHTEESFLKIKGISTFDHDKTGYKLVGKHRLLACTSCHTGKMTAPLKHDRCTDCHSDYHNGQFTNNGIITDCNTCHSVYGFSPSEFTIEQHNTTKFVLKGAHLATSCNQCHKKGNDWSFRNIGTRCVDCHKNEHKGFIPERFFPKEDCTVCHNEKSWKSVTFDHNKTGFKLEGEHAKQNCEACHYRKNSNGERVQKFDGLSKNCTTCHKDNHAGQFAVNGTTDCTRCHGFEDWKKSTFDHNTSRFKIDGQHKGVRCDECHKPVNNEKGQYIEYKFDSIECSKCHSALN